MRLKNFLCLLLMGIMLLTSSFSIYANENELIYESEKINNTLELVFEYLNSIELDATSAGFYEYQVPINDEIINITIEIEEQSLKPENFNSGDNDFNVSADNLYTYTLTVSRLNTITGGDLVYNLTYETKADSINKIYIKYYNSSINGTPPSGSALQGKDAYLHFVYGEMRFGAKAYMTFENLLGLFNTYNVDVEVVSFGNGVVRVTYDVN